MCHDWFFHPYKDPKQPECVCKPGNQSELTCFSTNMATSNKHEKQSITYKYVKYSVTFRKKILSNTNILPLLDLNEHLE